MESKMFAIKAIYDGNCFRLQEQVPVKEEYHVLITFTDPVKKSQSGIMEFFNTWDKSDVDTMEEIIKERNTFASGRYEL
jgi:hypothetical protein